MQQPRGPEYFELGRTLSRSRSTSMSSDSQLPRIHLLTPPPVNPPPSFIAPSAASQIITADQEFNTADFVAADDHDGASASAIVTPPALSALNGFLDHLLFNILATAKSTQLTSIRPALAEVLKPRLAKEVVSAADEELSEYMGGPEDEQVEFGGSQSQNSDFDLIRSWKLTRLRCMVYTRLGDMEEDDEEEYIAQDGLADDDGLSQRFSSYVGNITPAAAIFITSIIEHIGEQALVIAGETARSRLAAKAANGVDADADTARATMDRLVVEDLDMEKLALNPTLGRLWRTWRKRIRNPNMSRGLSRDSVYRRGTIGAFSSLSQKSSINAIDELISSAAGTPVTETPPAELDPASVPLPMNEHDVEEIQNPAFAPDAEGAEVVQTMEAVVAHKVRPHSLMVLTLPSPRSPSSSGSTPSPITPNSASGSKPTRHVRSRSLPNASYDVETPPEEQIAEQRPSPTAEERQQLETMYEHEEDDVRVVDGKVVAITPAVEPERAHSPKEDKTAKGLPEGLLETTERSSVSAASMEVVTSQASSGRDSSTSVSDRVHADTDAEILEGQGMAEKPKLSTVQRPKRKSSRLAPSVDCAPQAVSEDDSPRQGGSASVKPASHTEVVQEPVADTTTEPQAPQILPAADETKLEDTPRPVSASGESSRSDKSRPRSRPSPLPLATGGSQHHYGRSSAGSSASSATERAGVQRLSGKAPPSATSTSFPKSRRSDSFSSNREKRPVTAGSTTSQVSSKLKGLINRPPESGSFLVRSSSEISRASAVTGDSMHDDKSGLDELIRSEETIHYTLTPRSMREMEDPESPRWHTQRSSTADLADFLKNTGPPGEPAGRPRTSNASKAAAGSKSPQKKHTPIQIASPSPQQKSTAGQARDAKASVGSTREFANFLKSSSPAGPPTGAPNGATKTSRFRRFSDAAELSKKFTRPASGAPSAPRTTGPRPQARPAAIPREDSADLIDFIREGPPTPGGHRIPRTVAPFRDTMDSDDLESLEPSSTAASTHEGSMATKSTGSRTGLLESTNRTSLQASGPVPKTNPPPVGTSNGPFPARKQSRVPDPYAIDDLDDDLDDDELEELLEAPKPKREEESLMDFLRNVPPPESEALPQPFSVNAPAARSSPGGFAGASSIKARLLRNASSEKTPSAKPSRTSLRQPVPPPEPTTTATSNYTLKTGPDRTPGTLRTSPSMPSVSERQTETSALADFLRNTGPPEPPMPARQPPVAGGKMLDSNNISRLFARRKKVEV
ncbi:hypothetical protein BDV59DRAFT_199141 [Aspergillus ambiguus]|uniref:uncharacterized protein n=1 Tax=Aspergillus ambiguus TaxID=176160 RepID=UPI003CCDD1B7